MQCFDGDLGHQITRNNKAVTYARIIYGWKRQIAGQQNSLFTFGENNFLGIIFSDPCMAVSPILYVHASRSGALLVHVRHMLFGGRKFCDLILTNEKERVKESKKH